MSEDAGFTSVGVGADTNGGPGDASELGQGEFALP